MLLLALLAASTPVAVMSAGWELRIEIPDFVDLATPLVDLSGGQLAAFELSVIDAVGSAGGVASLTSIDSVTFMVDGERPTDLRVTVGTTAETSADTIVGLVESVLDAVVDGTFVFEVKPGVTIPSASPPVGFGSVTAVYVAPPTPAPTLGPTSSPTAATISTPTALPTNVLTTSNSTAEPKSDLTAGIPVSPTTAWPQASNEVPATVASNEEPATVALATTILPLDTVKPSASIARNPVDTILSTTTVAATVAASSEAKCPAACADPGKGKGKGKGGPKKEKGHGKLSSLDCSGCAGGNGNKAKHPKKTPEEKHSKGIKKNKNKVDKNRAKGKKDKKGKKKFTTGFAVNSMSKRARDPSSWLTLTGIAVGLAALAAGVRRHSRMGAVPKGKPSAGGTQCCPGTPPRKHNVLETVPLFVSCEYSLNNDSQQYLPGTDMMCGDYVLATHDSDPFGLNNPGDTSDDEGNEYAFSQARCGVDVFPRRGRTVVDADATEYAAPVEDAPFEIAELSNGTGLSASLIEYLARDTGKALDEDFDDAMSVWSDGCYSLPNYGGIDGNCNVLDSEAHITDNYAVAASFDHDDTTQPWF